MFTISQIANLLGQTNKEDIPILGYQIDSREVKEKELFFAIKGNRIDPHKFLKDVAKKGAIAAVVEKSYEGDDFGLQLIYVENVTDAIQICAKKWIEKVNPFIIAITGSVGKTTTKDFTATLLEKKFKINKSPMSRNSQVGLPLSILNFRGDEQIVILEMAMTEPNQIKKLVEIAPPDIALITNVSFWHVDCFENIEGIARAKKEIFSHPKTKTFLIDQDLFQYSNLFQKNERLQSFSVKNSEADYFLSFMENFFYVDEKGIRSLEFELPFQQEHFLHDVLAAISIARNCKVSWEELIPQFRKLTLPKMRFEEIYIKDTLFINDAYNACPDAVKMALKHLPSPKNGGKKIAVLGEMTALGSHSERVHREIAEYASQYVDYLLCFGKGCAPMIEVFQEVKKPVELFVNHYHLARKLEKIITKNDVILIKGSRFFELEKIIEILNPCS